MLWYGHISVKALGFTGKIFETFILCWQNKLFYQDELFFRNLLVNFTRFSKFETKHL